MSPGVAGAAKLKLDRVPEDEFQLVGAGGATRAAITRVKDLVVAGIPVHNIEFFVGGTDTGTAGLLGQNVLGLGDVEYDLPHGAIRLFKASDCGKTGLAYWVEKGGAYSLLKILPLHEAGNHTVGTVYVNGQALRATFDTGAPRTSLTRKAAERAGVKIGDAGVQEAGFSVGLGRDIGRSWIGPFKTMKIGDEEVRNLRLHITENELGESDMLIGADFFISHRVYVDNASHRMFFTYAGGKIFDTVARREGETEAAAPAAASDAEPKDAEGYSRRGGVFLAPRDFGHAIADFSRAIDLAPTDPRFLLQRAEAYLRSRRPALGAADLNRAVEIDPN